MDDADERRKSVFEVFFCLMVYDLSGVRKMVELSSADSRLRLTYEQRGWSEE